MELCGELASRFKTSKTVLPITSLHGSFTAAAPFWRIVASRSPHYDAR
jgi:hypothetical protein